MDRLVLQLALLVLSLAAAVEPAAAQAAAQGEPAVVAAAPVPEALDIIARAIARKREVRSRIGHYRYDAYVKFAARDLGSQRDSARSVLFISETRSSAYWEHGHRYQETVVARRQSRGSDVPRNLVAVGEIVDVSRSRIVLEEYADPTRGGAAREGMALGRNRAGTHGYAIPSPVGRDALDHYEYRALDTVVVDGRRAYRLAVEPKSSSSPRFVGTIDVADSSYDVVALDLGVNDAVRFTSVRNLRYQQRLKNVGNGRWMPYLIRLAGEVRPSISLAGLPRQVAGIRVPGLPEHMAFEQLASLDAFRFDEGDRPAGLGEYRVVVREQADRPDSAAWAAPAAVPLTAAERAAWARADSTERHPGLLVRLGRGFGAVARLAANPGYFHFNRVDGYYLGAAPGFRPTPALILSGKLGYALGSESWQYRLGSQVRLSEAQRLWVGGSYRDETVSRPTLISGAYNPTFRALFARVDPLDYYRERGLTLSLDSKLLDLTRLALRYDDARQSSLDTLPGYSFRSTRYPPRGNPPVVDGRLRAVSASLTYDSRQLVRSGGEDYRLNGVSWNRITVGAEVAAPSLIPNDFAYRRYTLQLDRQQQTLGLGITTIMAAGGVATGNVPPQRYFTVDFGMEVLSVEGNGFSTLAGMNYSGNRAAVLTVRHDFDRLLFAKSGLPLVRDLPFTLSVHGGLFWSDFINHTANPADTMLTAAPTPYSELGFSVGNLTPFLSPFNLSARFSWQLSSYATRRFRFGFGVSGP